MRSAPIYLLLAFAVALLMPSAASLWIDELQTYRHVVPPSLHAWAENFFSNTLSESLMPLGMFLAWLQGKVFGMTEWGLRAPNILWTWLAILGVAVSSRRWQWPAAPLLFAVQPFVWYCANEARPYSLQVACGAWMAAACVHILDSGEFRGWPIYALTLAAALLLATSLFGVVTVAPALVMLAWNARTNGRQVGPEAWRCLSILIVWGAVLGVYYLYKLHTGSGGAKLWKPSLSNPAFAIYEFAGFQGLGFPRDELRELARAGGAGAVLRSIGWFLPGTLLLGAALAIIFWNAWRTRRQPDLSRHVILGATVFAGVLVCTFALAMAAQFPFWGRHVAPAFPFYFLVVLLGTAACLSRVVNPILRRGLAIGTIALFLASSAVARWHPFYARDDYRSACKVAGQALSEGRRVWWNAASDGPPYYGVPASKPPAAASEAVLLQLPTEEDLANLTEPDLIVTSKPDTFDITLTLQKYCDAHGFVPSRRFKAFVIWERRGDPPPAHPPLSQEPTSGPAA